MWCSEHLCAAKLKPTLRPRVSYPYRPGLIPRIPLVHRAEDFESALVALSFSAKRPLWRTLPRRSPAPMRALYEVTRTQFPEPLKDYAECGCLHTSSVPLYRLIEN